MTERRVLLPSDYRLTEVGLLVVTLIRALVVFGNSARMVPFHPDEGDYIGNARYVTYLFLQHDVVYAEWGENYWTHTQPMMTRYIIGG